MKLAFIIDPVERLDPGHDTSVALMEAAQNQGHEVWIAQAEDLKVLNGKAWAILQPIALQSMPSIDGHWQIPQPWYTLGEAVRLPLEQMDAVFMRKDPPVSTAYLYATYLLDFVDPTKTLVVNRPQGLRAANEKMFALQFADVIPETIVTQNKQTIREFVEAQGLAVLKPLGGKAGEGILLMQAGDRNLNSLVEISTFQGQLPVMVQEYLPQAQEGDKRIILLDGEPIGALNRIPTGNEFRGNMATGGRVEQSSLTEREQKICARLAPTLQKNGLIFVGIDVIGGYLTEINVTSPTGIREIDRLDGVRCGDRVMEWLTSENTRGYRQI
ncbi:glutathione synthase [Altericista sp. CCNU0014]|uniref:glutathione synthase n=1 Tax=Altericista sp. CCNU0014 TaxID=3082949 RepID=UPI00384E23A9